jgi:hypothetical protein
VETGTPRHASSTTSISGFNPHEPITEEGGCSSRVFIRVRCAPHDRASPLTPKRPPEGEPFVFVVVGCPKKSNMPRITENFRAPQRAFPLERSAFSSFRGRPGIASETCRPCSVLGRRCTRTCFGELGAGHQELMQVGFHLINRWHSESDCAVLLVKEEFEALPTRNHIPHHGRQRLGVLDSPRRACLWRLD